MLEAPQPRQQSYQNPYRGDAASAPQGANAAAGGEAAGLVELETSVAWNPSDPAIQRKRRVSRMRRAILNGADIIQSNRQKGGFRLDALLLTPTYRDVHGWSPRHVASLRQRIQEYGNRRGWNLAIQWVAELQKRGAVHYHLLIWGPKGFSIPKPDQRGWWPHGFTNIVRACRGAGYLAKYASKNEDVRQFPKGLRLHGRSGLDTTERRHISWWLLPRYVREVFPELGTVVRRARGGGWFSPETGEWIPAWKPPPLPVRISAAL